jgi:hypothetical protein
MGNLTVRSVNCDVAAPALAPLDFGEMLRDSDTLLALMGSEALDVVANLASSLTGSASNAGAVEIADAANTVRCNAAGRKPVALARAMRDLSAAIARARHECHIES